LKFASLFDFRRLFATLSGAHPAPRGGGRLSRGTRPRRYTAASSARRAKAQSGTSSTSMYRASAWKNRGSTKRTRSEERRVGKEVRSRVVAAHIKEDARG